METLTNLALSLIVYNPTFIAAFIISFVLSVATYWFINRSSNQESTSKTPKDKSLSQSGSEAQVDIEACRYSQNQSQPLETGNQINTLQNNNSNGNTAVEAPRTEEPNQHDVRTSTIDVPENRLGSGSNRGVLVQNVVTHRQATQATPELQPTQSSNHVNTLQMNSSTDRNGSVVALETPKTDLRQDMPYSMNSYQKGKIVKRDGRMLAKTVQKSADSQENIRSMQLIAKTKRHLGHSTSDISQPWVAGGAVEMYPNTRQLYQFLMSKENIKVQPQVQSLTERKPPHNHASTAQMNNIRNAQISTIFRRGQEITAYEQDMASVQADELDELQTNTILLNNIPTCLGWTIFKETVYRSQLSRDANIIGVVESIINRIDESGLRNLISQNLESIASRAVEVYRKKVSQEYGHDVDVLSQMDQLQRVVTDTLSNYCKSDNVALIKHFLLGMMIDNYNNAQDEKHFKTLVSFCSKNAVDDVNEAIEIQKTFSRSALKFKKENVQYVISDGWVRSIEGLKTLTSMLLQDYQNIHAEFNALEKTLKESGQKLAEKIESLTEKQLKQQSATETQFAQFDELFRQFGIPSEESEESKKESKIASDDVENIEPTPLLPGPW